MTFLVLVHKDLSEDKDAMTIAAFDRDSMAAYNIPLTGKNPDCIAWQMCLHCAQTQNMNEANFKGYYIIELEMVEEYIPEEIFNQAMRNGIRDTW